MAIISKLILFLLLGLPVLTLGQAAKREQIAAAEAKHHIGETATVCGKVVAVSISKYAAGNLGWPIFLDLDKPEPNPVFTIATLSSKRLKSAELESTYQGKVMCATGKITSVRGVPEIITSKPSDIEFKPDVSKKGTEK
jgi:hypothetical protein